MNPQKVLQALILASVALSSQIHITKRDVADLQESYDYIVVGGGLSGLVVANRLSADPNSKMLES